MNKVSKFLDEKTIQLLYNSLVLPYLNYGNIIWGRAAATHLSRLLLLQKRAVRIVNHTDYFSHTAPLFHHSNILKIEDLNIYQCAIFLYKIHHHIFPHTFASLFPLNPVVHSHQTRAIANNSLIVPFARTSLRHNTIACVIPNLFNSLFRQNSSINNSSLSV
jgi:hypothetical protein